MINPYQAPPDPVASVDDPDALVAEFQLTGRQIRFAESKFLLLRCGVRLTLASLVMIALAVIVAFDRTAILLGIPNVLGQVSLVLKEIAVMAFATVIYLLLVRHARKEIRFQLEQHGVVDGAGVSVDIRDGRFTWTTPQGRYELPVEKTWLINTGKGAVIRVDKDLFIFVPKDAAFAHGGYRRFVRGLQNAQVGLTESNELAA